MDSQIRNILRQGLIAPASDRLKYRRELETLPEGQDRNYCEAALKDPNTTIDDLEEIESGGIYKRSHTST